MSLKKFILENFGSFRKISQWGFNAGVYITMTGLFASRYTISLGMIVMGSSSLLYALTLKRGDFVQKWKDSTFILLMAILLLASVTTSFIGSEILDFAIVRFRLYAAFLLCPLILLFSPPLTSRHYKNYLLFSLCAALFSSVMVLSIYLMEYEVWSEKLEMGQALPTPVPHIRFGMFLSFTFLACLLSLFNSYFNKGWKVFILIGSILLFIAIIMLSIRTAWIITMIGTLLIFLNVAWKRRSIAWIGGGLIGFVLIAIGSYLYLPSVRTKVDYMRWDWSEYQLGKGASYSDSERSYSIKNGYDVWTRHKLLGVGSGDMLHELELNAGRLNMPVTKIPHNQFLVTALCGGILSLILFLTGYLMPLYKRVYRKHFMLNLMLILYSITMMFEPTFETSVGVLSFVFILVMILKYIRNIQPVNE